MNQTLMQKISDYRPGAEIKELIKNTRILFLVGPTGAGKDSVKDELLKTGRFHHIVSHTTRSPRINHGVPEQDGREYHFITEAAALKMLNDKEFIEAKIYSGNLYGTSISEIQAANKEGKIAMTDLEVQGVAEYKKFDPGVMAIFLLPPSFQIWQERLQRRYGDVVDAANYRLRLETALDELEQLLHSNRYVPIVNDDLSKTIKRIEEVVESPRHVARNMDKAHEVARRLAEDIKGYLAKN